MRSLQAGDLEALVRFRASLPAAANKALEQISGMELRLHEAQSCLAREYGFPSWADLRAEVEWRNAKLQEETRLRYWLALVYGGNVLPGNFVARPRISFQLFQANPGLVDPNPYLACALCDDTAVARAITSDPHWVIQPGGPLNLPPLVALTMSSIAGQPEMKTHAQRRLRQLLDAGFVSVASKP